MIYALRGANNFASDLSDGFVCVANKVGKDIMHEVACSPTQVFDSNSPAYKDLQNYKAEKAEKKKV